jgi:predicted nucleic acid-binding protein
VKFALDTNVFVDAFRDETFAEALTAFLEQAANTASRWSRVTEISIGSSHPSADGAM